MYPAKYVIIDGSAIVFSPTIAHSQMVGYGREADGAGFVRFDTQVDQYGETIIVAKTWGRSESLDVISREEDAVIITRQISNAY